MNITKRQPVSVGEMITGEFLVPMALTQGQLAEAMGVS
jgi:plasmid maintenance system antidote protein VapI